MDFQGILDRLVAIRAPGLVKSDEPRKADPKDKKDKGRAGDPFVIVEARELAEFVRACRDDDRLHFEQLVDLTATDPSKDAADALGLAISHAHAARSFAALAQAGTLQRRQHAQYRGGRTY